MSSVEFKSCEGGVTFLTASQVYGDSHIVATLLMIESERKLLRAQENVASLATSRRLPIFRGFDITSLSLFTQNRMSSLPLDT